jgi:hypothetical protein
MGRILMGENAGIDLEEVLVCRVMWYIIANGVHLNDGNGDFSYVYLYENMGDLN